MNATRLISRRSSWWIFAFLILTAGGVLASCSSALREHASAYTHLRAYAREHGENRDLSRERMSEKRLYRAVITPQETEVPLNKLHQWTLHVEGPGGLPIDSASITVDGGMPEHGHGLPTKPRVTRALGNGDYLVEGMKFQMPGWWVVAFEISGPEGIDTVTFNLML